MGIGHELQGCLTTKFCCGDSTGLGAEVLEPGGKNLEHGRVPGPGVEVRDAGLQRGDQSRAVGPEAGQPAPELR